MKRLISLFLIIVLWVASAIPVFACDDAQTEKYLKELLFGDYALTYSSKAETDMLLNAVYLCSEQCDSQGATELAALKKSKVRQLPSLSSINVSYNSLMDCCHGKWDAASERAKKQQAQRKKLLKNTVSKVFNLGIFAGSKTDSFSAFLYYSHILADYLAGDTSYEITSVKGQSISTYNGTAYVEINGNQPVFSASQRSITSSEFLYSSLDSKGRCGKAVACIGEDVITSTEQRDSISNIKPSGWSNTVYTDKISVSNGYVFNRCHLIAHELGGKENKYNLITGTSYMNHQGMLPFENKVRDYIADTGNHVLYRATPIFSQNNNVADGVQLEAYSVEDNGDGISFNVFCFNIQPGIKINYADGSTESADTITGNNDAIPFAVACPSSNNPDLMFEIDRQLEILFSGQLKSDTYKALQKELENISEDARDVVGSRTVSAQNYITLKEYEYKYMSALKTYVPLLLKNESFFSAVFK